MNEPPNPLESVGDAPVEARIVAWVLGEASAFEAAELERLCEERPELRVFRRRMEALHGLLGEASAPGTDAEWRLPDEKRKGVVELVEKTSPPVVGFEPESNMRRHGRRMLLGMAACATIAVVVWKSMPQGHVGSVTVELVPRTDPSSNFTSGLGSSAAPQSRGAFYGAEFDAIKNRENLGKVVDNLDLANRWHLDRQEAITRLGKKVSSKEKADPSMIDISVKDPVQEDAREIAREVAMVYKDYRMELEKRDSEKALAELSKAVRDQEDKVEESRKALTQIVRNRKIIFTGQESYPNQAGDGASEGAINQGLDAQDYVEAKKAFESQQELLAQMKLKQVGERVTAAAPAESVIIHDDVLAGKSLAAHSRPAVPALTPATPPVATAAPAAAEPVNPNGDTSIARFALDASNLQTRQEGADQRGQDEVAGASMGNARERLGQRPRGAVEEAEQASGAALGLAYSDSDLEQTAEVASKAQGAVALRSRKVESRSKAAEAPGGGVGGGLGDSGAAFAGKALMEKAQEAPPSLSGTAGPKAVSDPFAKPASEETALAANQPAPAAPPPVLGGNRSESSKADGVVITGMVMDKDQAPALRRGDAAIQRNNFDAVPNNPDRPVDSASSLGKDLPALADAPDDAAPPPVLGNAAGKNLAFPTTPETPRKLAERDQRGEKIEVIRELNAASDLQAPAGGVEVPAANDEYSKLARKEMKSRREGVADSDALLQEGRDAYSRGDYGKAAEKFDQAAARLPDAPMSADRKKSVSEHLSAANVALAMQNRKAGKYEEAQKLLKDVIAADPDNADARRELGYLDEPIRTNPALTNEAAGNVDEVRRGLYTAEGNFNLGKYDEAKREYEDVLRVDKYNFDARRGLEKIAAAKTDYYRAAYDHTRAELLTQVDKAWELSVPEGKSEKAPEKNLPAAEPQLRQQQPQPVSPLDVMEEVAAAENPYSTFSLNISDASFQVAQAALAKGERPDPAAIKVEQFYNAVDYGDPAPAAGEPVAAAIEQSAHPLIPGRNLVRVALRTASTGRSAAQPLRLTLLVDQSGSMVREDRRLAMEQAVKQLGGLLTGEDKITVIGFSRTPRLLADGLGGDQGGKLDGLINQTASEGGTNLEEAMKLGEQLALRHQLAGAQNRIVLFTDGAANLGDADPEKLKTRVEALRQRGIAFDIAGIGADGLNDRLLGELARHGNGRYYVVSDAADQSFARQLAGAFRPAAENVKVQVHFNPQRVGHYKLIGFEKERLQTEDFRNDAVDAAELAADEAGVAIYQVEPLAGGSGEIGEVSVRFKDSASGGMVERAWTIPNQAAPAFDRATPSMQLAGLAMLAGEKLRGGPLADATDFRKFAGPQAQVKQAYGASPRVGGMLRMIDQLK